jgi:hypothetical protein
VVTTFRVDASSAAYVELADRRGTVHQVPLLGFPDFEQSTDFYSQVTYRLTGVGLRPVAVVVGTDGADPMRVELGGRVVFVVESREVEPPTWCSHREQPPDGHTEDGRPYWF